MSRIGKLPITLPEGVEVKLDGHKLTAKGPLGTLELNLPAKVKIAMAEKTIKVLPPAEDSRPLWGLTRSLIQNLVEGVSKGYQKQLEIHGVGYKAQVGDAKLTLNLGFSHPIEYDLPAGIEVSVEANNLTIKGIDKQLVGQVAAEIRDFKRPEPYKGKGIRYTGEHVRRKAGKAAGKAE